VTVGAATYVKWSAALVAEVPPVATTVTSTVPAEPAGALTVSEVEELTTTLVPAVAPNFTDVTFVKSVPVTVTDVPAVVGPWFGLTAVTVGAAT
jgi:hypothetical protein